jgi:hypothetical protein
MKTHVDIVALATVASCNRERNYVAYAYRTGSGDDCSVHDVILLR